MTYAWPSSKAATTHLDNDRDSIGSARADLKLAVENQNKIIDMFNLNITEPANGKILVYNSTNDRFEIGDDSTGGGIALTDLSVSTASASGAGSLAYNNSTGVFTFTPASPTLAGLSGSINDLTDVDTTGVANNKILKYNSTTSKFEIADESGGGSTQGKHDLWIPVSNNEGGGIYSSGTDGALSSARTQYQNGISYNRLIWFATGDQKYAQFSVAMPKSWNESNIEFKIYYFTDDTNDTGNIVWNISHIPLGDGDAYTVSSYPTGTEVIDARQAAQTLHITNALTRPISNAAENDIVFFQIYRNQSSGSDTFDGSVELLGVKMIFTTNADTDG